MKRHRRCERNCGNCFCQHLATSSGRSSCSSKYLPWYCSQADRLIVQNTKSLDSFRGSFLKKIISWIFSCGDFRLEEIYRKVLNPITGIMRSRFSTDTIILLSPPSGANLPRVFLLRVPFSFCFTRCIKEGASQVQNPHSAFYPLRV